MNFFLLLLFSSIFLLIGWEIFLLFISFNIFILIKNLNYRSFIVNLRNFESRLILLSIVIIIVMLISNLNYYYNLNNFIFYSIIIFMLLMVLFICFSNENFFYFYIMFELSVIPTFILITGWGYSLERLQSGIYIFFYTFLTALPFLFFLFLIIKQNGTFLYFFYNYSDKYHLNFYWWIIIRIVFLVKFPIFLIHIWLPKAHVEAPVSGSMILAGVLLKLGGFGFWKSFILNLIRFINQSFSLIFSLSLIGSIIIRIVCMRQFDIKSLIAYSSIAHIGPILSSIICFNWIGWFGRFFIIIAHGFCSSGLFYILTLSYEQFKSRSYLLMKNISIFNPILIYWWFFLCSRNISCPPTMNFISEIFIIISIISSFEYYVFLFFMILLFLRGAYSIYLFIRMNHGREYFYRKIFNTLNIRELLILIFHSLPIIISILFIQIFFYYISLNKKY